MIAHAQKPDFVFRRNGRVHLNQRGRQFGRLLAARGVRISGSNAGYTMFRGSVKGTGYPLHSPVFPSLPLTCVTVCHHISAGVYKVCTCPVNQLPTIRLPSVTLIQASYSRIQQSLHSRNINQCSRSVFLNLCQTATQ